MGILLLRLHNYMDISFNNLNHLDEYIKANNHWILIHFERDSIDRELVKYPEKIIENGGYFVSTRSEKEICGICVLYYLGDGNYELGNLSVSPASQGHGFGSGLVKSCIEKLEEIQAKSVIVQTNHNLKIALSLYKKYGFELESDQLPPNEKRNDLLLRRNFSL